MINGVVKSGLDYDTLANSLNRASLCFGPDLALGSGLSHALHVSDTAVTNLMESETRLDIRRIEYYMTMEGG